MATIKELNDAHKAAQAAYRIALDALKEAEKDLIAAIQASPEYNKYKRGDVITTTAGEELEARYVRAEVHNGALVHWTCADRTKTGTWRLHARRTVQIDLLKVDG